MTCPLLESAVARRSEKLEHTEEYRAELCSEDGIMVKLSFCFFYG